MTSWKPYFVPTPQIYKRFMLFYFFLVNAKPLSRVTLEMNGSIQKDSEL